jgi:hypothetical protein
MEAEIQQQHPWVRYFFLDVTADSNVDSPRNR